MKHSFKTNSLLLAAALLLGLAGCTGDTQSTPQSSTLPDSAPPASTPGVTSQTQSEDGLLSKEEVATHVPAVPLEGAPPFLTREQQQLYLDAYEMYAANFGTSSGGGMRGEEAPETQWVDGSQYSRATGPYARWADFKAALAALFTEAYIDELLAPGGVPMYLELDGDTWFMDGARGGHVEWVGPDSFAEAEPGEALEADDPDGDAPETIHFFVVGHYENMSTGEPYETQFPLTLEKTDAGWRFSQFSITF